MKNQIRILTVISIVLSLFVGALYLYPEVKRITEWDKHFSVESTENIQRIEIS